MKVQRAVFFFITILILSILACNAPVQVAGSPGDVNATASVISPAQTIIVIVENTATPIPSETPIPFTPTPQVSPKLTLSKNTNCRVGPNTNYNIVDQIAAGAELPVIGRNEENSWWQVVNATNRECWVFNENATPNTDFSSLPVGEAPPLPGVPQSFFVVNQLCQPGPMKFSVTLSWASGGGETAFRIFRDGNQLGEIKASRLNYKDTNAPLNKNLTYEIAAVNENGSSEKAVQIVPACK